MDKLSFMKAFCRIVELKSFSKAAQELGLSTAVLSKETKLLEEDLGAVLLQRSTRKMTLTRQGKLYYDESLRLLDEFEALEHALREDVSQFKGALSINAPQSFGLCILSPIISEFRKLYPEIELDLCFDDNMLDVIEGGYDLSIRIRKSLESTSLIAKKIGQSSQHLYAGTSYLKEHGFPQSPSDLSNHSHIAFSLADHLSQWDLMGKADEMHHMPVSPALKVNNSLVLKEQLEQGAGIGSLPEFVAFQAVQNHTLQRVLPDFKLTKRYVYVVYASKLNINPKVRAFVDFLQEHLPPYMKL